MVAVVGGVKEEDSRVRAQTSDLGIDHVGIEEVRQEDEERRLEIPWLRGSTSGSGWRCRMIPVMVADGKLGSGFGHMNYQASYNPWNSKTRQG